MRNRLLFMDVDGTLTNGNIYVSASGEIFKSFNVRDGFGIHDILPKYNIIPIIITKRKSEIVTVRCNELEISEVYQGVKDKTNIFINVINKYGIIKNDYYFKNVAYIGDDIPDLDCMLQAEYKGCPADACIEIKNISNFVSSFNGGDGAVRDFIEWLVNKQGWGL